MSEVTEWDFHMLMAGSTVEVPVLDGSRVRYVNLDNAASTPPFKKTIEDIGRFAE